MNKNWLFGTTALALAASFGAIAPANAQGFKTTNTDFTVGGYVRGFAGAISADRTTASLSSGDVQMDARVDLTARFAVANGLQGIGVIQLQDQGQATWGSTLSRIALDSVMRRAYAGLGGAFGQVQIGRQDNASQQGFVGSFDAFTAGSARLGKIYDFLSGAAGPQNNSADDTGFGSTSIRLYDRQSEKLIYISPRIEGFQLIASWTPELRAANNSGLPAANTTYRDGISGALNFTRPIGDVAVSAYGTYYQWSGANPSTGANTTQTATTAPAFKLPDASAWGFGANAVWQGIQLGGSYTKYRDVAQVARGTYTATDTFPGAGILATNVIVGDSRGYEGGVGYIFGPASVSLNYFNGEADTTYRSKTTGIAAGSGPLGKDKRTAVALNGAYTLAPGVSVQLSLFTLQQKGGFYSSSTTTANGVNTNQKASGGVSALVLAF